MEYGRGDHSSVTVNNLISHLGYKSGVCTTGNSLDHTEKDDELMAANDASVKDMEAAAIAWVAEMLNVPFFGVKVLTDIVDGDRATEDEVHYCLLTNVYNVLLLKKVIVNTNTDFIYINI